MGPAEDDERREMCWRQLDAIVQYAMIARRLPVVAVAFALILEEDPENITTSMAGEAIALRDAVAGLQLAIRRNQ